jgi:apolipoprotein N-acyltransferase
MMSLLFGILHGWSIANPWNGQALWWLQLLAMAWLVGQLSRTGSVRSAVWQGGLFALAWFVSSLWWLYTSMHDYGGLAAPLAVLAVMALSALLASFYALTCGVFVGLRHPTPTRNSLWEALIFAALWLLADLTRSTVMTGFPWSAAGYAHMDGPLIRLAPYIGVYGISATAAFITALFVLTRSCLLKIALPIFLLALSFATPAHHETPLKAPLKVTLLQGNIPQNEKFDATTGVQAALSWYKQELLKASNSGVDLVVAPETAIPVLPQQLPLDYLTTLQASFAATPQNAALVGIPLGNFKEGYTNSVIGLSHQTTLGSLYRYDKHHLVPFGEFIPPMFRWFTDLMDIPLGDFNRGALAQPSFAHAEQRFALNICFEDLFGEELALRFANPTTAPTVFVNVSNMGWFGSGIAIDEHLNISRMRALEFDRPMIRATNTGATVIINHHGIVTYSMPRATRGVLTGNVEGQTTITPYANWASHFGLYPLWLLASGVVILTFIKRKLTSI